jgi:hypothetical protein
MSQKETFAACTLLVGSHAAQLVVHQLPALQPAPALRSSPAPRLAADFRKLQNTTTKYEKTTKIASKAKSMV